MSDPNSPGSHYDRAVAHGFLTGRSEEEVVSLWARMIDLINNAHMTPHDAAAVVIAEEARAKQKKTPPRTPPG